MCMRRFFSLSLHSKLLIQRHIVMRDERNVSSRHTYIFIILLWLLFSCFLFSPRAFFFVPSFFFCCSSPVAHFVSPADASVFACECKWCGFVVCDNDHIEFHACFESKKPKTTRVTTFIHFHFDWPLLCRSVATPSQAEKKPTTARREKEIVHTFAASEMFPMKWFSSSLFASVLPLDQKIRSEKSFSLNMFLVCSLGIAFDLSFVSFRLILTPTFYISHF